MDFQWRPVGAVLKKGPAVDDRDLWDPFMLEDYLASIELGVDGDQVLELRRRVLGRSIPMLTGGTRDGS